MLDDNMSRESSCTLSIKVTTPTELLGRRPDIKGGVFMSVVGEMAVKAWSHGRSLPPLETTITFSWLSPSTQICIYMRVISSTQTNMSHYQITRGGWLKPSKFQFEISHAF